MVKPSEEERPLITVYIPCYNYGRYVERAVESVLAQSEERWELIIVDDGSTDETPAICEKYRQREGERIQVIRHEQAMGLQRVANRVLEMARGKYVIRLDADDWLDESALLVMSQRLEEKPEVALVYPNYCYVDARGRHLGVEQRKKVGDEDRLMDLPAHGACTMVRRRVLKTLGGYDERHDAQDGYELWLKLRGRYEVESIETPLFYYRQHGKSLSRNEDRLLVARQRIKQSQVEKLKGGPVRPRVLGLIPAKNTYEGMPNLVLSEVGGKPLLEHTLEAAFGCGRLDEVWVTTDCDEVVEYCAAREVEAMLRPATLSGADRRLSEVVSDAVRRLERSRDYHPDIVVVLSVHSPLRDADDIEKALDSLILFDADSVISVYEDYDLHFTHGREGLEPLNPAMIKQLRLEREGLYVFNGAITALWRDSLRDEEFYGEKIGHIVMPRSRSLQLKSALDRWMLDRMIWREKLSDVSPAGEDREKISENEQARRAS